MSKVNYLELFGMCKHLYSYLRGYIKLLLLTIFCMAIYSLFAFSRTFLGKALLDIMEGKSEYIKNSGYSSIELLIGISISAAFIAIFLSISQFFHIYFQNYLNSRVIVDIQKEVFNHLMCLSMKFFNNQKMGDLLSRLTNDIQAINLALRYLYGDFFLQPLMLVVGIGFCLYYSWQLSLVTFIIFPAIIVPILRFGKSINRRAKKRQISIAEVTQEMQQVLSGIRIIKGFHGEKFQQQEFNQKNEFFFKRAMKVVKTRAISKSMVEFLNNIGLPFIIGLGGYLVLTKGLTLTPGDLIAFIGATALMYKPIRTLAKGYNGLQEALASANRVFELLHEKSDLEGDKNLKTLENFSNEVSFENVSFSYDDKNEVLQNVSFTAKKGETVAIVGPSGAGKSTLLDLMLRFYDPTKGSIKIDGKDIRSFSRQSFLEKIAVVNQDPYLFHKTIGENIAFAKENIEPEQIIKAAKAANIHEFIESLPNDYKTLVGERGVMISGGQRQRITIARAILKNFSILLLDEATSSLDTESEQAVQKALENLMDGCTTFVVAHRLSTIKNAHKIILLENGKVVDIGSHSELYERAPLYQRLYEKDVE